MKVLTFEDDLLGLKDFADRLEKFMAIEQQYVEGGLVVALSSKFGSGKTTFLQMWKSSLESAENQENKPLIVLLNAWESDCYGDPLFAIVSALVNRIQNEGKSAEKLVGAAKDVGWFGIAIGGQIVKKATGIDPVEAGGLAEKKKAEREGNIQLSPDSFSIYEGRKKAMSSLKEAIREFIEEDETRILFLVDELDRCRPDYAISYLETIKHIFDIKGAVFLLAADRQQLKNSAKTAFGADLDFEEYYRKFIHREITLPEMSDTIYATLASRYVGDYLESDGGRNCFMELDGNRIKHISELVGALRLTPRQIQEVFRTLGHICETTEENKGRLLWCLAVGSILMSALKIGEPRIFHLLGTQQLEPKEAFDFLSRLFTDHNVEWWFFLCLTGGGLRIKEGEKTKDILINVGLSKEGENNHLLNSEGEWIRNWGDVFSSRFVLIREKIEQLAQWN